METTRKMVEKDNEEKKKIIEKREERANHIVNFTSFFVL